MDKRHNDVLFVGRILSGIVLLFATAIGCAAVPATPPASFSQQVSPTDRAAAGFDQLTLQQRTLLDVMIQRDIAAARAGDVVAFAKTFTERRTAEECRDSGISALTDAQRAKIDSLVAAAIAIRPASAYVPYQATPETAHEIADTRRPWQVHGDVSMFVGGGSGGRSFYGGSFDTWATDPTNRLSVGVGAAEVRGKGLGWGCGRGPLW